MISVLIADDQTLILDGIRVILNAQPDIRVVAAAQTGTDAMRLTGMHRPDVVLLDIQLPDCSGIDVLRRIKREYPKTVVLMLTTFDPDEYIFGAFENGADGYLLKDMTGDKLAAMVRDAAAGNILIPASVAARLIARIPRESRRASLSDYRLTAREAEIAGLIRAGYHNERIAKALGISMGTTKNYISTLYSTLEVKTRQDAVRLINSLEGGASPDIETQ
jgi:DNA-binding NarL/FixJ family response regulator